MGETVVRVGQETSELGERYKPVGDIGNGLREPAIPGLELPGDRESGGIVLGAVDALTRREAKLPHGELEMAALGHLDADVAEKRRFVD